MSKKIFQIAALLLLVGVTSSLILHAAHPDHDHTTKTDHACSLCQTVSTSVIAPVDSFNPLFTLAYVIQQQQPLRIEASSFLTRDSRGPPHA